MVVCLRLTHHLTAICPSTPTGLLRGGCWLQQGRHHRPDGRRRRHSDGDRHHLGDAAKEAVHLHPPRSHRGEKGLIFVFVMCTRMMLCVHK